MGRRGAKKEETTAAPADPPAATAAASPAAAAAKTKAASPATATKAGKAASPATATKAQHDKKEEVEEVFEENEVVLAKDSGQLYEAKVMRVDEGKGNAPRKYFIHYQGWKSKWDKWVGSDELLKKNETTLKLQAQLKQATKKRPAGGGAKAQWADGEGGEATGGAKKEDKRGKKGGAGAVVPVDPDVEPVVEGSNDPQVKLAMPFTLKKQLVDDWEMVTREPHQLVPLPRTPSAATVLANFLEKKKEKGSTSALQLRRFEELLDGIRMYFDKALPLILLYRHEREQYDRLKAAAAAEQAEGGGAGAGAAAAGVFRPSDVYGAEHLLRLFVRLPHLLAQTPMSPVEVTQVQAKLGEFLKYLQKQHGEVFLTSYRRKEECLPVAAAAAAAAEKEAAGGGGEGKGMEGVVEGGGQEEARANEGETVPMEVGSN